MTAKRRLGTTGYYVVSILIAVVAMIPFLWMISTSLKSRGALMSIPIEWIPAEPSLDAYGEVFSRFPFLKTIGNSLFISVSYTVITLISASMAAFAFAKIRFRCANLLLKLYLATMMIPTQVTMIPLFVIMNRLGLIDSYASVILPSIFRPFAVFMLVQQMRTVPVDYPSLSPLPLFRSLRKCSARSRLVSRSTGRPSSALLPWMNSKLLRRPITTAAARSWSISRPPPVTLLKLRLRGSIRLPMKRNMRSRPM